MTRFFGKTSALALAAALHLLTPPAHARELEVLLVQGAPGTAEYGTKFQAQIDTWRAACAKGAVPVEVIGGAGTSARLEKRLATAATGKAPLWLVLVGHGTFDGREAKFNAEGPDFEARQLAAWLSPLKQEIVIVHTASASGGFLRALAGKNRVIITATKSPDEVFYARFGEHFADAIAGLAEADLDQDKQVSLLEAFRHASKAAATFYENENRLATEHALLEDNGDAIGTRREVLEADAEAAESTKIDGARASQLVLVLSEEERQLSEEQRTRRDALERDLQQLKEQRAKLGDEAYYAKLEKLLRALGEVYGSSRPAT